LFYSYSHRDEGLRKRLETHLSLLEDQGVISGWHDRCIEAGTEWDGAISENLDRAGIILLLVSADFLASKYCRDVEVARAMERHEAGTARVIPVILRPAEWHSASFGKLQALPRDVRPVTTWTDRNEAFVDIARDIRTAARSLANAIRIPLAPSSTLAVTRTGSDETSGSSQNTPQAAKPENTAYVICFDGVQDFHSERAEAILAQLRELSGDGPGSSRSDPKQLRRRQSPWQRRRRQGATAASISCSRSRCSPPAPRATKPPPAGSGKSARN
jgi:hypothetical protein